MSHYYQSYQNHHKLTHETRKMKTQEQNHLIPLFLRFDNHRALIQERVHELEQLQNIKAGLAVGDSLRTRTWKCT
ncbi:hypothetical protein F442_05974 [Phytophthora nicotianae P10297]|uniref:Uncharacterized protein n=1 Tax=Phytophthora nicotianae P10297 TaxID=1317064 RepID=W2ZLW2_PHYNI|nr:hypothetical protein F442_05974 [Phytophthora nicotianae P10297]